MLAFIACGGRSEEVITLGCGPGDEGSIPSAHPIFSVQIAGLPVPRLSGSSLFRTAQVSDIIELARSSRLIGIIFLRP